MDKVEFKQKAKQQIDNLFNKIDELEAKKEGVSAEVKDKYEQHIKNAKAKKSELQTKYDELENSAEEQWEETKNAFSKASESFHNGLNEITSLFK